MPAASGQTFAQFLESSGATEDDLDRLQRALAGAMELSFVFNPYTLGEHAMARLGLDGASDPMAALGLTRAQTAKLNDLICGVGTLEGAPGLREEHLPVFDCANRCGRGGVRFIAPEGHIRMMAAVQPFISGAISKTINLPNEASVDQIGGAYRLSWELGVKANALYRDGSKLSQVLSTSASQDKAEEAESEGDAEDPADVAEARDEVADAVGVAASRVAGTPDEASAEEALNPVEKIVERVVERPLRRRLPNTRQSLTHKFNVAGHEGYLTVGLYDDGQPGELFITMAKEGSTIGGLMDSLGTAISVALQYGVPVESLVSKFTHQRFEPAGMTDNADIPFAKSLVDYIFRWMGMEFIEGYRDANAPRRSGGSGNTAGPRAKAGAGPSSETRQTTPTSARTESHGREPSGAGHGSNAPAGSHPRLDAGGNGHGSDHGEAAASGSAGSSGSNAAATEAHVAAPAGRLAATLNTANSQMMGDAPACDVCGSITVRNGTCYKCLNCGNSMGCS
jgi:ribonucleoside-diphosphate reductase alpha chain